MNRFWKNLRMFIGLTALTGLAYPLLITAIAQMTLKQRASGDFIEHQGKIVGAALIAQSFKSDRYFWPRPSAIDYNPLPSGGSNLSWTSEALIKKIAERQKALKGVQNELLFASGSGLDPHISPSAAYFQMERISKARRIDKKALKELIDSQIIPPSLGFLGEPRVNVLLLNLNLDKI